MTMGQANKLANRLYKDGNTAVMYRYRNPVRMSGYIYRVDIV